MVILLLEAPAYLQEVPPKKKREKKKYGPSNQGVPWTKQGDQRGLIPLHKGLRKGFHACLQEVPEKKKYQEICDHHMWVKRCGEHRVPPRPDGWCVMSTT